MESIPFKIIKGFGAGVALLIPILIENPAPRSWYNQGYGWPLLFGWKSLDDRPIPFFASITDYKAFFINLTCGILISAFIWFVPKIYIKK